MRIWATNLLYGKTLVIVKIPKLIGSFKNYSLCLRAEHDLRTL